MRKGEREIELNGKTVTMSPEEIVERLRSMSRHDGQAFRRLAAIERAELEHARATSQYRGSHALSDASKCFFLETVDLINTHVRPKIVARLPDFYTNFVPRIANGFQTLCGAEGLAVSGYPFQAYTLLRNVFDNHLLTSAALQGVTNFHAIEGLDPSTGAHDPAKVKRLRKSVERAVQDQMTGAQSGLGVQTLIELARWDGLFDKETHGARLSLATHAMDWMTRAAPLPVLPRFKEQAFAMFLNRHCEVAWMAHRLLPHLQPPGVPLPSHWKEKWRALDEIFEHFVMSLTVALGKGIGAAMVEFVHAKFPFSDASEFPK